MIPHPGQSESAVCPECGMAYVQLRGRAQVAEAEAELLREAMQRIVDHGHTHDAPCWALHKGDCADAMQEIARSSLTRLMVELAPDEERP